MAISDELNTLRSIKEAIKIAIEDKVVSVTSNVFELYPDYISQISEHNNIWQIIQSAIPLTDVVLHLLDCALISGSGSYLDFVDYISNLDLMGNYFYTEAEWQQAITNYGVCGKFFYDSTKGDWKKFPGNWAFHIEIYNFYHFPLGNILFQKENLQFLLFYCEILNFPEIFFWYP